MVLNGFQIEILKSSLIKAGLNIDDFCVHSNDVKVCFCHRLDPSAYRFEVRESIQGASLADVFCQPYTYQPHIYLGCDSFSEVLKLVNEWIVATWYKLEGKPYYHKVFLSHSSKDKSLINEFVDRVLIRSCCLDLSDIIYTSRETTGVEPGEDIPSFIKENLKTSSLVLFLISDNYKSSEVCLNEMGAAWALEKKTMPILLPATTFKSLGWLTSLSEALKIDDSEGLDKIYSILKRKKTNTSDWNRQKESFMNYCKSWRGKANESYP